MKKNGITIIGSSGVGKTTLTRSLLKNDELKDLITLPKRLITRPPRDGDNLDENRYVTESEIRKAFLSVMWKRDLNAEMYYGFETPEADKIPLYSANNAIYQNPDDVDPVLFFESTTIIGITVTEDQRKTRLMERSPDVFLKDPNQMSKRLEDKASNVIPFCDFEFKNDLPIDEACEKFAELIFRIIKS